jgi:hypothetical protein
MGNIKYGNIGIIPCFAVHSARSGSLEERPARAALRKLLFRCKVNDMSYEL